MGCRIDAEKNTLRNLVLMQPRIRYTAGRRRYKSDVQSGTTKVDNLVLGRGSATAG